MTLSDVLPWVAVAALTILAGLFSTMEAAFTRLSPARLAQMELEGETHAARMRPIAEDKPRYINLMLLLEMLTQVGAVMLAAFTVGARTDLTWWAGLLTALVAAFTLFVIVGVSGRTLGQQHPYGIAAATAWIARVLETLLGPIPAGLILLGNAITPGKGYREGPFATEAELLEVVGIAEQGGVVAVSEREMIESVFGLGDTIVREVMVPRTDMVWIEGDKSVDQALALALRSGYSRIPVVGDSVDDVVGIAYLKDLAGRARDPQASQRPGTVSEAAREAVFVPDSKPVDELLREMQAARVHVAIVVDEYGGTSGLVTIEDILEEIVGEIADEYDTEAPPLERLEGGALRVSARLSVDDLAHALGISFPPEEVADVDTVSGLMAQLLGRVPIPGGAVDFHGYRLVAQGRAGRRHKVETVLVEPVSQAGTGRDSGTDRDAKTDARADTEAGAEAGAGAEADAKADAKAEVRAATGAETETAGAGAGAGGGSGRRRPQDPRAPEAGLVSVPDPQLDDAVDPDPQPPRDSAQGSAGAGRIVR